MIRKLSYKKVQFKVDVPIYVDDTRIGTLLTKQVLQKVLKDDHHSATYHIVGVPTESELYESTVKSRKFIKKFISQKYKIKMNFISTTYDNDVIEGVYYRRVFKVTIDMPLQYKREWRLRQLLDKKTK
ncbi:MAG: hypothetical protein SLAVMIC_00845 [uncultured marine phage]|uniref:Uncharacterized protein n=1 Tax=uncultured marine phage TaxID=707152 RepID=A0A8D9C9L3_9VIRU|nr:MAG: hypothetical protein SLAVMIC_00845 [uncultured marine phage]